jgi:hypothetical protein
MSEVRLYKLDLSAGDFSFAGVNFSTAWGGSDAPVSGYPEFAQIENIHRAEAAGASGQDVIDAVNTTQYRFSWVTMAGVGPLLNGQFDCRGGGAGKPIKVRWKQFFKSSALAEAGICVFMAMACGGIGGADAGLGAPEVFFLVEAIQTSGANFQYHVTYGSYVSGTSFSLGEINSGLTSNPGTMDNAEHEMIATIVPSTVTSGVYTGDGTHIGSAVLATDGSIDVSVDGGSVISGTGLKFVINAWTNAAGSLYLGKTLWFGD